MTSEREVIMNKARRKRQRRAEAALTEKRSRRKDVKAPGPNATVTEKVVDLAQSAAAQVSDLVKTAAHKITGTPAVHEPAAETA